MQQPPPPAVGVPTLYQFLVHRNFVNIAVLSNRVRHNNTRNDGYYIYRHMNPAQIVPWAEFNFQAIMLQFGNLLQQSPMKRVYLPNSPVNQLANSEPVIRGMLDAYLWRLINNSLDVVFYDTQHALTPLLQQIRNNMTEYRAIQSADGSLFSQWVRPLSPDRIAVSYFPGDRTNVQHQSLRMVGDVKCSWNWDPDWRLIGTRSQVREYYQVISQVYTYAQQCHARYFYIATDQFLVCYRRRADQNGVPILGGVDESPKIHWNVVGVQGQPGVLTAALALWYLHMLASTDNPDNHPQPGGRLASPVWSRYGIRLGIHPLFWQ